MTRFLCVLFLWMLSPLSMASLPDLTAIRSAYDEKLVLADSGIYPLGNGYVVKGVARIDPTDGHQALVLQAEKQVLALISQSRSETINKKVSHSLHRKILARKGFSGQFSGTIHDIKRHTADDEFHYAVFLEKQALSFDMKIPVFSELMSDVKALLNEEIAQENYKALAQDFNVLGVITLSDYFGMKQLVKAGILTGSFASIGTIERPDHSSTDNGIVSCERLKALSQDAGGTIQSTLKNMYVASCQSKGKLPKWYPQQADFRSLVSTSLFGNGYLIFSPNGVYGNQFAADHFQNLANEEFNRGVDPDKALTWQIASLSQQPINAKGWNQLGAVLRAMNEPSLALAAHRQAIVVSVPTATSLIHMSKSYLAMGEWQTASLYGQSLQYLTLTDLSSDWVQSSLKDLAQQLKSTQEREVE